MRYDATDLTDNANRQDLRNDSNKRLRAIGANEYIPLITIGANGKVNLKYIKGSEANKRTYAENEFTPVKLVQTKASNIVFNGNVNSSAFKPRANVRSVTTLDGKSFPALSYYTKQSYGRYSGASVVLLFENKGNLVVHEFAGSVEGIDNEIKAIKEKFNITDEDITMGFLMLLVTVLSPLIRKVLYLPINTMTLTQIL